MELRTENEPFPESNNNLQSYSPLHDNPIANGPTIEELLSVKYEQLNDADQTDIATTIRNAILIPNNLNVSDDCLRILCNRQQQQHDSSYVLDTTAESPEKEVPSKGFLFSQSSSGSDVISDQDQRCARELAEMGTERRVLRQVSPLPKGVIISGTPILHGENSGNAVFNRIGEDDKATAAAEDGGEEKEKISEQLTFNGRIPAPPPPRVDHVIIQIDPDDSMDKAPEVEAEDVEEVEPAEKEKSGVTEPSLEYTNERSPDLFADCDDFIDEDEDEGVMEAEEDEAVPDTVNLTDETANQAADRLMQRDNHLLKRLQTAFSGVLPPPSVTNVTISLDVIVSKYKEYNGQLPSKAPVKLDNDEEEQFLLKSCDTPQKAQSESWPELKNVICHDVYYNLSNAMEQYENLTVKYQSRFLGTETASSFVMVDLSSAKKRANRTRALQQNNSSPGRRLSHLARRRAIFSCANLQGAKEAAAQAQKAAAVDSSRVANRQILLPVRRMKRNTPGQKRKTPSSSVKKRTLQAAAAMNPRRESLTRETSKRALFQSPGNRQAEATTQDQQPAKPKVTPEVAIRVDKSKRALFSSPKFGRYPTFSGGSSASTSRMELSKLRFNSMTSLTVQDRGSEESLFGKRKRRDGYSDEDEDSENTDQIKVLRTESPRRSSLGGGGGGDASSAGKKNSFMRSQSFTAEQLCRQKSSMGLPRTSSEMHLSRSSGPIIALTDDEKKKLLWVVSQTLQRNKLDGKNAKFKEYATTMAKVIKRLYLESVNKTGYSAISVSEQMNKLANNIAYQVLQNKNELEIYSAEKLRIQSQNRKKLTGYINSMDYERYRATTNGTRMMRRMSSGVFSETSSVTFSQCSVTSSVTASTMAADENRDQVESLTTAAEKQTSYNVLRENVDTEQRQQQQQLRLSSQKGFSGKDQKNVSPYSGDSTKRKLLVGSATLTTSSALISKGGLNVTKAKRQISFDA